METTVKNKNGNKIENPFPNAEEAIDFAKAKGNEAWENAKSKGESLWNSAQANSRKSWRWTKGFIHKNPGQAVGFAVLLGVVIGAFLKSNRRN